MGTRKHTVGEIMRSIEHLRTMRLNGTSDFEEPETQGYLQALQDIEEKYDSGEYERLVSNGKGIQK